MDKQETIQCVKCKAYTVFVNDKGECEDCQEYTMDQQLKEEASNGDI